MDEDEIVDGLAAAVPVLEVAFVAFCLWLGVRFYNRRERWTKRTLATALIGAPVLYIAGFGAVCRATSQPHDEWIAKNVAVPANAVITAIYRPLGVACANCSPVRWAAHRYLRLWVPSGRVAFVPVRDDGNIMAFQFR